MIPILPASGALLAPAEEPLPAAAVHVRMRGPRLLRGAVGVAGPVVVATIYAGVCVGCRAADPMRSGASVASVAPVPSNGIEARFRGPSDDQDASDDRRGGGEDDEDDEDTTTFVRPCVATQPEHDEAKKALDALSDRIERLKDGASPKPLAAALDRLLEHPCFELAAVEPKDPLTFDTALALRTWWHEGGHDWLEGVLELDARRVVATPPTPRRTLVRETTARSHPLAPLLCPIADASCGRETAGWARRAAQKLELVAAAERSSAEAECAELAKSASKHDAYRTFRDCVADAPVVQTMLPLGRIRAPVDGWIAWTSAKNRGNCHELRAYDLATGSTYVANDCTSGAPRVTSGRVPISALREAAWMLLLAGEAQRGVRQRGTFYVPEGIALERGPGIALGAIHVTSRCGCIFTRPDSWSWLRDVGGTLVGQVSGEISERRASDADRHARDLFDIVEDGFDPGCAPALPPSRVDWSAPGPAQRDAPAGDFGDAVRARLEIALSATRPPSRSCGAKS